MFHPLSVLAYLWSNVSSIVYLRLVLLTERSKVSVKSLIKLDYNCT